MPSSNHLITGQFTVLNADMEVTDRTLKVKNQTDLLHSSTEKTLADIPASQ